MKELELIGELDSTLSERHGDLPNHADVAELSPVLRTFGPCRSAARTRAASRLPEMV